MALTVTSEKTGAAAATKLMGLSGQSSVMNLGQVLN